MWSKSSATRQRDTCFVVSYQVRLVTHLALKAKKYGQQR